MKEKESPLPRFVEDDPRALKKEKKQAEQEEERKNEIRWGANTSQAH